MESGKNQNKVRTTFRQRKVINFSNEEEAFRFYALYKDVFDFYDTYIYEDIKECKLYAKVKHEDWLECIRCLKLKKFTASPHHCEWRFEGSC